MPVRFRCHYCNQLLGIARRKIGMNVACPTCHNSVLVPPHDAPDVDQPSSRKDPLFEGSDLDALLQPALAQQQAVAADPAPAPPPPAWQQPAAVNVEPYIPPGPAPPAASSAGVVLSPFQATLFTVGAVLLLAAVFAVGLLIGRFCF